MFRRHAPTSLTAQTLKLALLTGACSLAVAQDASLFAGLPYEEDLIRDKIVQHSVTVDSSNTAAEIPSNLLYQLALRDVLTKPELRTAIPPTDLDAIAKLPAPWDASFLARDQEDIGGHL